MTSKRVTDWEKIELEFRAGILTLRELSEKHGVSHVTIHKRAKRDSWVRDIAAKIQARAGDLVNKAEANRVGNKQSAANERQLIDAGAEAILRVKLGHRTRITRHSELVDKLQVELETDEGDLASRVDISKKLAETMKTLITLERDAFDIVTVAKTETELRVVDSGKEEW